MKIAVSVETTCDLTKEILEQNNIQVIPFHITLGDKMFLDGEVSTEEMFDYVDKTGVLPKTNAINEFEYTEYFENLKKEYDAIIHISLSSGLSLTYSNAKRAAQNLKDVFVIDSQSLSTGIGLLALYACDLVNEGFEPSVIAEKVQDRVNSVQASFVVERLDYLHKGGRCNLFTLLGATILKIRPRIVVKNGKMGSDKKIKGNMGKVVRKYCESVFEDFNTPDYNRVFITYTSATEEMLEEARKAVAEKGFKKVYETRAGGTIASHCGGNTLGVLFFNDGTK